MERLTYVAENGEVLFHPADLPDDEGITITQLAKDGRYKALEEIAERLANREQAEEQGLLLRLPCKVGDTLYRVNKGAKEPVIMMRVILRYGEVLPGRKRNRDEMAPVHPHAEGSRTHLVKVYGCEGGAVAGDYRIRSKGRGNTRLYERWKSL